MVYLSAVDAQHCRKAEGGHNGHDPEYTHNAAVKAYQTAERGGRGISGMVPGLIDAKTGGKTGLSHQPQRHARDERAYGGSGNGLHAAGYADGQRSGGEKERAAGKGNENGGAGQQTAFGAGMVCQGSQRGGAQQSYGVAEAHDDADFVGRPALLLQIDAQKGSQAVAYIRQTKAEQRKKRKRTSFVFHGSVVYLFYKRGKQRGTVAFSCAFALIKSAGGRGPLAHTGRGSLPPAQGTDGKS